PKKGRNRATIPTISWGATDTAGFCTEFSGVHIYLRPSAPIFSAASLGSVTPILLSSSKAMVYPLVNLNGVTFAPQFEHRTASGPDPSKYVSGFTVPHSGHFPST